MSKPSREEWDKRLKLLIERGSYHYKEEEEQLEEIKELTFKQYKRLVNKFTEKVKDSIEGIECRGWNSFHIDHKISISYGFKNGILPESIADITNLRMTDKKTNCDKGRGIFVDEKNEWIIKRTVKNI